MENFIPYILYKTGPFEKITHPKIVECFTQNEKMLHCRIKYYNDMACYNFIKDNFPVNVLTAYNMLIPAAYKADLWRLCVLYMYGGIYGDLTQTFLREYDVNKEKVDMILIRDKDNYGIYNAFIAVKKYNGFIKYCIEKIIQQILRKKLGVNPLDITGPLALKRHYYTFFNINRLDLGLKNYRGLDNKIYRISMPFYNISYGEGWGQQYCNDINHRKIIKNYIANHHLLYNSNSYCEQWHDRNVFRKSVNEIRNENARSFLWHQKSTLPQRRRFKRGTSLL